MKAFVTAGVCGEGLARPWAARDPGLLRGTPRAVSAPGGLPAVVLRGALPTGKDSWPAGCAQRGAREVDAQGISSAPRLAGGTQYSGSSRSMYPNTWEPAATQWPSLLSSEELAGTLLCKDRTCPRGTMRIEQGSSPKPGPMLFGAASPLCCRVSSSTPGLRATRVSRHCQASRGAAVAPGRQPVFCRSCLWGPWL